jgi:hypothetical protein
VSGKRWRPGHGSAPVPLKSRLRLVAGGRSSLTIGRPLAKSRATCSHRLSRASPSGGRRPLAVASPKIAQQCLDAGLLDEIQVDLVPVLLGKGIPFFENLATSPVELEDPEVVEGTGVTHLAYRVRR